MAGMTVIQCEDALDYAKDMGLSGFADWGGQGLVDWLIEEWLTRRYNWLANLWAMVFLWVSCLLGGLRGFA